MLLFYTCKPQRIHTLLKLDTISSSHYGQLLMQGGALREVEAQRREGEQNKRLRILKHAGKYIRCIAIIHSSNMEPGMVLEKRCIFKDLSVPH